MQPVKSRLCLSGFWTFNRPATRRGSECNPQCVTVLKNHQHFMNTRRPLFSLAGEAPLPNSCAYYSVVWSCGDSDSAALWESGGCLRMDKWEDTTVREKKHSFSVMRAGGTPCAGDVTQRTGTYFKLCGNERNLLLCFP